MRIKVFLLILFSLVVVSAYGESSTTIGIILPLTGKGAAPGEAVRNGANLANEALGNKLQLLFEDSALDNTQSLAAARKLINVHHVDALLVYGSGPANVVAPLAESAKIPMIGASVDPHVSAGRSWVMTHWARNETVTEILLQELINRKIKSVSILTTQVQGCLDLTNYFTAHAAAKGIKIISNDEILPTESDYRTVIARLQTQKPDAVFNNLYFGQAGNFAAQAKSLGYTPQFFSGFPLDSDAEINSAKGGLEGAFYASNSSGDGSFDELYKSRYGKNSMIGGISAYDIVMLFGDAFQKVPDKSQVNTYLHNIKNFQGKSGVYAAMSDNRFDVPANLRLIKNGSRQ